MQVERFALASFFVTASTAKQFYPLCLWWETGLTADSADIVTIYELLECGDLSPRPYFSADQADKTDELTNYQQRI